MRILVEYEKNNRDILQLAAQFAKAFEAEVFIVKALGDEDGKKQSHVIKLEQELEHAKDFFIKQNITCNTHLLARGPAVGEVLVNFAIEKKVDQIIIGVKKRSQVGKMIFGSTPQYVILNAPCPVTTVL